MNQRMRMNPQIEMRIDKTAFSVMPLSDPVNDKHYWLKKTPTERIQQIEILRRISYGHLAAARLQRVLDVAEG